jgi:hypothetical protein
MVGAAHFLAKNYTYLLFVPCTYCNTITTPSCAHEEEQKLHKNLSAPFMLITPKYKNRVFNAYSKRMLFYAYQQANAVLCLSVRFMLISWRIWRLMLIGVWKIIEIQFTRNDPFFEARSVRLEFFFLPNQIG